MTKETNAKAELARLQREEDFRTVMGTPHGRRLIFWILDEARVFSPCFTGNSATFYNEGRRELGLMVFKEAVKQRELFNRMNDEQTQEKR